MLYALVDDLARVRVCVLSTTSFVVVVIDGVLSHHVRVQRVGRSVFERSTVFVGRGRSRAFAAVGLLLVALAGTFAAQRAHLLLDVQRTQPKDLLHRSLGHLALCQGVDDVAPVCRVQVRPLAHELADLAGQVDLVFHALERHVAQGVGLLADASTLVHQVRDALNGAARVAGQQA